MEDLVGALMAQGDFPEVLNRPSWQYRAACRGLGTEDYFTYGSDVKATKAICARCPVQPDCLAVALDDPGLVGVWGGTTIRERRVLRRLRSQAEMYGCAIAAGGDGQRAALPNAIERVVFDQSA